LKALQAHGDKGQPGDVIMRNDAYGDASHGPDVGFAVPVFHEGRLVAFAATTVHHLDIGALSPGSCGIVDAIDAFAEGLQMTPSGSYCGQHSRLRPRCWRFGGADRRGADRRQAARQVIDLYGYERFTRRVQCSDGLRQPVMLPQTVATTPSVMSAF
jgi:Hydantoinase B/oxoprolinase